MISGLSKFLVQMVLFSALTLPALASVVPATSSWNFDLSNWSNDVKIALTKVAPELETATFDTNAINNILKILTEKKVIRNAQIKLQNGKLILTGTPVENVEHIKYHKLSLLEEDQLKQLTDVTTPETIDENKYVQITEKIRAALIKLGYRKAQVSYIIAKDQNGENTLEFTGNPGPKTTIKSITVEGLPLTQSLKVNNAVYWDYVGRAYTDESLKDITKSLRLALNDQGYYTTATPAPEITYNKDDTFVTIKYKTNAKISYDVVISNNKQFSALYLKSEVLGLEDFFSTDESIKDDLSEKLKKFYLENGYYHYKWSHYSEKKSNTNSDIIRLVYEINEGPLVKIKKVTVTGTFSRDSSFYVNKFFEVSSGKVQDRIFNTADIEQSAKNMVVSLQNEGFVSAKMRKLGSYVDPKKLQQGFVNISLDEGSRTTLKELTIENNKAYNTQKILTILGLRNNQSLNLTELEKSLNMLKTEYYKDGFLEFEIKNLDSKDLVTYNEDYTEAKIHLVLSEGPKIYVNQILVDGTDLTHDKVILTELEFKVGDLLTPYKIEESLARLQKTGLFASAEIKMLEANTSISERTIVVNVVERNPGLFTAGVGIINENQYTIFGSTGIAYRNIGGWGRALSLRAEASYNPPVLNFLENKVTVGFLEPYLFDSRSRFRVNYTTSKLVSDYSIRQKTITNQAIWSIEQDITSHLTAVWQIYNIANYVDEGITREDEIKYGYGSENMVIASMGPTFDLDYRDNVFNPFKGNFSSLNIEYGSGALGSHNVDDFLRFSGQTTLYTPLSSSVTWANSLRGGYITALHKNDYGIPFEKKGFILGGRTTIRGFEASELFPSLEMLGAKYNLPDSSSYQLIKSEVRFPLGTKSSWTGGLFYDGGKVYISNLTAGTDYKSEWRDSVGFGLRYNLPIGPLNIEYARKLNRKNGESDGAFHLSVGVF